MPAPMPSTKRLLLMRHAKSAWPDDVPDHERPLALRGRKAAPAIAAYLPQHQLLPELALVSTAERTRETWLLMREALPAEIETRYLDELYEASCERLLDTLQALDADAATVMLIGHNPGLQELALRLTGSSHATERAAMALKFPTAGLAVIDFEIGAWEAIVPGAGRLRHFVTPRSLG